MGRPAANLLRKVRAWLRGSDREEIPPHSLAELGRLLPTFPRTYFDAAADLPFRGGRELDLATAWWCAEASMLAYQDPKRISELAATATAHGWELELFGPDSPTLAVLLKSRGAAVLAFRGTRVSGFERLDKVFTHPWLDYADLKADAQFMPAPFATEARVHGGMLGSFERFWERHGAEVARSIGDRMLLLTGHSLGAALATILAASGRLETVAAVYSFGSPRVGDLIFRDIVSAQNLTVHRFVHGNDLVTTLAPEGWFGYTHPGKALHIKRDGSALDDVETNLAGVLLEGMPTLLDSLRQAILNLGDLRLLTPTRLVVPQDALADHAPLFYVERIRELARRALDQPGVPARP